MKRLLLFVLIIMGFCGRFASDAKRCPVAQVVVEPVEPLLVRPVQDDMQCRLWVDSVLDRLSLKERVGQLFIYTIAPHQDKSNRELLRKVIEDYKVGGLLFSGGLMQNQVVLTNEAQRMADIPLLITFDGEWGLSMRLRDTPAFPKNMVLGCIQNDSLLYEYGCEMARQCKELGVQVNFAPVADVNINPKNPVINTRSFGEDPVNVANKVIAYARGLEDGGVLSVAKHFPGHGDTDVDSHKALPVLTFTRERLDSVELYPFKKVIEEGLGDNTYFWNYACGWVLILSRFLPIVGQVAIAGLLAQKRFVPESAGTLKTDTFTFAVMTFAVIFIVAALSFFPAHALSTIAEHFSL